MEKFFSKLIALAVLLIMAPSAVVFASNDDGDTEEEQTLQELLDSFKFGVDDYAYETKLSMKSFTTSIPMLSKWQAAQRLPMRRKPQCVSS